MIIMTLSTKIKTVLKNNKTHGQDKILKEYLKTFNTRLDYYVWYLCNTEHELNTCIILSGWITGIIYPVYKSKGCQKISSVISGLC